MCFKNTSNFKIMRSKPKFKSKKITLISNVNQVRSCFQFLFFGRSPPEKGGSGFPLQVLASLWAFRCNP
jgi:hypothetical protein